MVIFGQTCTCRYLDSDRIDLATFVFLAVSWSIWALYTDIKVQQFLIKSSLNNVLKQCLSGTDILLDENECIDETASHFSFSGCTCAQAFYTNLGCLMDVWILFPPRLMHFWALPTLSRECIRIACGSTPQHWQIASGKRNASSAVQSENITVMFEMFRNQGMSQDLSAGNIKDVKSTEKKT